MNGVNRVQILGRLGADVECRSTAAGSSVASLRVATTERWRDKATGETQERTEWHRIKLFGRLADVANEYLAKGSMAYFEGSLRTDKYTDKDGVERYTTYIVANDMQMLSGSQHAGGGQAPARGANTAPSHTPSRAAAPAGSGRPTRSSAPAREPAGHFDHEDEDIPFLLRRNVA